MFVELKFCLDFNHATALIQSQCGYFHLISLRIRGAIFIAKLYQQFILICAEN